MATPSDAPDLRRRTPGPATASVEIAPAPGGRHVLRSAVWWLAVAGAIAVVVIAFRQFTASWRIAIVVVGLMAAYMLAVGRMVEGRADRID